MTPEIECLRIQTTQPTSKGSQVSQLHSQFCLLRALLQLVLLIDKADQSLSVLPPVIYIWVPSHLQTYLAQVLLPLAVHQTASSSCKFLWHQLTTPSVNWQNSNWHIYTELFLPRTLTCTLSVKHDEKVTREKIVRLQPSHHFQSIFILHSPTTP